MIYLQREGGFRDGSPLRMSIGDLDYWVGKTNGYIEELNRRRETE